MKKKERKKENGWFCWLFDKGENKREKKKKILFFVWLDSKCKKKKHLYEIT